MLQALQETYFAPTTIRRTFVRPTHNRSCDLFGRVCREIWHDKAAAKLAASSRVSVRTAEYWLAGSRKPSAAAEAVVIFEIFGPY
jgi:hypothetical protein